MILESMVPGKRRIHESDVESRFDLKDVTKLGREAVSFLDRCGTNGVTLENCSVYVRKWITRNLRGKLALCSAFEM